SAGASRSSAPPSASAGSASAMSGPLLLALAHAIGANDLERAHELVALGGRKAGEQVLDHVVEPLAQAGELLAALGGQVQAPGPPVAEVGVALDQPGLLEPVDHPAQRDRFDVELVGVVALIPARRALEHHQHPGLWTGHA